MKLVYVQLKDTESSKAICLAQVKKYVSPNQVAHLFVADVWRTLKTFVLDVDISDDYSILSTEIVKSRYPGAYEAKMMEAKKIEITGLMDRETL